MRSESLDDDPLLELDERPDVRRDVAVPRDEPPLAPEERPEPEDPLAPEARPEPEDRLAPDERVAFFAADPDDRFEPPVAFFAVEPALPLALPAPLDAAAALVCRDAAAFVGFCDAAALVCRDAAGASVCASLEPEERDDAPDVLLAELRAVVAALREPPLPVLALRLVAFWFVWFPAFFVVATRSPFPGLLNRYPVTSSHNPCTPARMRWAPSASGLVAWLEVLDLLKGEAAFGLRVVCCNRLQQEADVVAEGLSIEDPADEPASAVIEDRHLVGTGTPPAARERVLLVGRLLPEESRQLHCIGTEKVDREHFGHRGDALSAVLV